MQLREGDVREVLYTLMVQAAAVGFEGTASVSELGEIDLGVAGFEDCKLNEPVGCTSYSCCYCWRQCRL